MILGMSDPLDVQLEQAPDGSWIASLPAVSNLMVRGKTQDAAREGLVQTLRRFLTDPDPSGLRDRPKPKFEYKVWILCWPMVTVFYLAASFLAPLFIFTYASAINSPWRVGLAVVGLVFYNSIPILWWWALSQRFDWWIENTSLGKSQRSFESSRFKTNGDHAKAFFAISTAIAGGLILKVVIEDSFKSPDSGSKVQITFAQPKNRHQTKNIIDPWNPC